MSEDKVPSNRKAVVLLSGGLDSATALFIARRDGWEVECLSIHYGQLHEREIKSAQKITTSLGVRHWIIPLSLPWGGSALLQNEGEVPPPLKIPKGRTEEEISHGIPATYVPARNSIFLSMAASLAEARGCTAVFFGANILDYSGYPDCRPEFIAAFEEMIRRGTRDGNLRVITPLLKLKKSEIIVLAKELSVPLEWTWSCYAGGEHPCGECDSCILRARGFKEAEMIDPAVGAPFMAPSTGRDKSRPYV